MLVIPDQALDIGMHLNGFDFHTVDDDIDPLRKQLQETSYAFVSGLNKRYRSLASLCVSVTEDCSLVTRDEAFSGTRLSIDGFYDGETLSHQYMVRRGGPIDPVKAGQWTLDCQIGPEEYHDRLSAIMIVSAFLDL